MKKNIVPLLAIAFVVAVISTAIFYGLFASKLSNSSGNLPRQNVVVAARKLPIGAVLAASDVRSAEIRGSTAFGNAFTKPEQVLGSTLLEPMDANQALTKGALLSRDATENGTVPTGMRAITIHVLESGGVLSLLHPGSRVDIQAISDRNTTPNEALTRLRTIFQNVEVLSTSLQGEQVALHFLAPPVTVLVRAEDADSLAVADTGARLRLTLRNRLDESSSDRGTVIWSSGVPTRLTRSRDSSLTATLAVAAFKTGVPKPAESLVLLARVVSVTEKGAQAISSSFSGSPMDASTLHVTRFHSLAQAESLVRQLGSQHDLEIVSSRNIRFENGQPVSFAASSGRQLSVAIHSQPIVGAEAKGKNKVLRVQPVVSWSEAQGTASRSLTADLPLPFETGFVISGIPDEMHQDTHTRRLLLIVTPLLDPTVALAERAARN